MKKIVTIQRRSKRLVPRPYENNARVQKFHCAVIKNGFLHCNCEGTELLQRVFIKLIRLYQKYISPMKTTKCPYFPSCSQYGLEAIEKYGVLKGGILAAWRILRCNPFSKGGYDPVP